MQKLKKAHIFDNPYSNDCAFTFEAPPGYTIHRIVNLSDFRNITSNNSETFGFQIDCMGGGGLPDYKGGSYSKTLRILVKHKETGEICDTLTKVFTCSCPGDREPILRDPVTGPSVGMFNVSFTIPKEYTPLVPMNFYLYDNTTGNRLKSLYTVSHSGQFVGQFDFNMLQYPNGTYHITVENDDQILDSKQFVFVK